MTKIFGSMHPFYEDGAINGRKLANAGFMDALLRLDPFEEYHFFVANPQALQEQWAARETLPAVRRGAVQALQRTELISRLRAVPYHVFHFSDPVSGFADMCALRNRHAPELFPVTAVNHSINYQEYASRFLAHMWEGCGPRDLIGANSRASLRVLQGWYAHLRDAYGLHPTQAPAPQLRLMHMGMAPELLPPPRDDARQTADNSPRRDMRLRLRLREDSVLLLLFGRVALDDKMDPQPLLLALRRVRSARPELDMRLVISGFADARDNAPEFLQAVARLLDVPLHVLPNPSDAEKFALFAAADIFISPSDNIQETFGLSLLEAAGAELPAIAADWDGYRDIIIPGQTGLLVDTLAPAATPELDANAPALFDNQHQYQRSQRTAVLVPAMAEAITLLAADPTLRQSMGRAARAHALEHFTWQGVARRWLALWEELRATPLPPATEARMRAARHPYHLPFGAVFAPYATATLPPELPLRCTDMGHALRERRLPWHTAGKAPRGIRRDILHKMLVLARARATVEQLVARCGLEEEDAQSHILWAVKHDLLEATAKFACFFPAHPLP